MNLQKTIRRILREQTESGGGIFYHNSDYDFNSFNAQIKKDKKTNYLFFSNEPNTFIDRKYTYKVKLQFDPNKIFNTFKHINDYGIKYTLEDYKDEVLDLFKDNLDYFLDKWTKAGVDSIGEVMEYYIYEGGDEDDMVLLLYYFLTNFNDSWAIIETDKFLDFIESKGFNGFVTHEEGLINIACKDFKSIEIIGKKEMWSDEGEGVKSLKEDTTKKQNPIQDYIDENGFNNAIEEFGFERIVKKLNLTPEVLFEKYNLFEGIVSDDKIKKEILDTLTYLQSRKHILDSRGADSVDEIIDFIISMTIDGIHSFLINWNREPHDWKVPQTPKVLKFIYGDWIKNNNLFKRLLNRPKNIQEDTDNFIKKIQKTIDEEGIFFAINFFGGINNLAKKLKTTPIELTKDYFLNKEFSVHDFDINSGGYDFNFTITQITDDDDFWIISVKILDGEVTMMVDDGKTYDLFGTKIRKKSYWWEIQEEVKDIISDILDPFKPKIVNFQINHNLQ